MALCLQAGPDGEDAVYLDNEGKRYSGPDAEKDARTADGEPGLTTEEAKAAEAKDAEDRAEYDAWKAGEAKSSTAQGKSGSTSSSPGALGSVS